jgi:hypothetical protein
LVLQLQCILLPLKLAHHHLSQFRCRQALQELGALPASQRSSTCVLLLIGRCLYELVEYARAAEAFEAARAADPHNLEVGGSCLRGGGAAVCCVGRVRQPSVVLCQ